MRIVTMGVYGFDEEPFFAALEAARIDLFVDTRRRRGLRGHEYAFANSQRLQDRLAEMGIPYVHRLDLAPSDVSIKAQDAFDHASGIGRRERDHLTTAFTDAYQHDVLDGFDSRAFVDSLGPGIESVLIFCVEGAPTACHRGLLAARIAHDLDATVEHITP